MGFKFNPLAGTGLDIVGTSGGGGSQTPNYVATFNATTDWTGPSGGLYTRSIPALTHGKGTNPVVQVLELDSGNYIGIGFAHKMDASGNITLETLETPDNRFAGKIIISENN